MTDPLTSDYPREVEASNDVGPEPGIPEVSVVIPVIWGGDRTGTLVARIAAALDERQRSHEILLVADGVRAGLIERLRALRDKVGPQVRIVTLMREFGESVALRVGFEESRGSLIVACSEAVDVELSTLGEVLERFDEGADLVVGRREPRLDSSLNRLQSAAFHRAVGWLTSTSFNDLTSGLRIMRREVAQSLDLYGDLHNFIPILAHEQGFVVEEAPMPQWIEKGDAKGGIRRPQVYLRRMLDVVNVFFLTRFTQRPLRFFGTIGLATLAIGLAILLYLGGYRVLGFGGIADRPLLLLGLLLVVLGTQSVSIGLLGELIIFTRSSRPQPYRVAEQAERGRARSGGDDKGRESSS